MTSPAAVLSRLLAAGLSSALLLGCVSDGSGAAGDGVAASPDREPEVPAGAFTATVSHHSDGDTLWVTVSDAGETPVDTSAAVELRLLRIDTPELARDGEPAECWAEAATDALRHLLPPGTTVRGAYDVERRDRFGRDLVHLWTDEGTWVNGWMLSEGHASVITYPPNTAFTEQVRSLEADARTAARGRWDPDRC